MVGGGPGAGIAQSHRLAAQLDGHFNIVAGAFSRDPGRNRTMGAELGVAEERIYGDFETMARAESQRADCIDCVTIVAPNNVHAPASLAFIERGVNVVCEKPVALSAAEARQVMLAAERKGVFFALTHNYSAYPMVFEARDRICSGAMGKIRIVQAEYAQGARSRLVEAHGDAKTAWRMDAAIGGPSTVLGDIGTHALHLALRITGLDVAELSADISTMVEGRRGDDNAHINLRFSGGARGHIWASMVANGNGHGLRLRVFCEYGSLEWAQEAPDHLWLRSEDEPSRLLRRGEPWLGAAAKRATRTKSGQPEGYIEGFANIYSDVAEVIRARIDGRPPHPLAASFATAEDGLVGMEFIETAIEASKRGGAWTAMPSGPHSQKAAAP
jgi:predicted dehydrogenase